MTIRRVLIAVTVIVTAACGNSATTPTGTTLHAEVSDPAGDAHNANDPQVSNPPDLIHGMADVSAGTISFTIMLTPAPLIRRQPSW